MLRTIGSVVGLVTLVALSGASAAAQDVVMNSAETINVGNIKLGLFPTALLSKNDSDTEAGIHGRLGFGLSPRLDVEAKLASFDGLTFYGGDFELWLVHSRSVNLSAGAGAHVVDYEGGGNMSGIDTTLTISTKPRRHLELYGALKLAFESPSGPNYTAAHLVPGLEYRVARDLDFLAEIGIALNDHARTYASVGLAYYLH